MTEKFSTQWKNFSRFFHTMEKSFPQCGKPGGILVAALLALSLAPSAQTCAYLLADGSALFPIQNSGFISS